MMVGQENHVEPAAGSRDRGQRRRALRRVEHGDLTGRAVLQKPGVVVAQHRDRGRGYRQWSLSLRGGCYIARYGD